MTRNAGAIWGAVGLLGFALGSWTRGSGRTGPASMGLTLALREGASGTGLFLLVGLAVGVGVVFALALTVFMIANVWEAVFQDNSPPFSGAAAM